MKLVKKIQTASEKQNTNTHTNRYFGHELSNVFYLISKKPTKMGSVKRYHRLNMLSLPYKMPKPQHTRLRDDPS